MAVKIVRQHNKIALLGSPTSAAAQAAGREGAPAALRAAGLPDRLRALGYDVADLGDDTARIYKSDDENPRARNIRGVLACLDTLKPRIEQAVKSGALPLLLSGDSSVVIATAAGARRYFRHVGLIYMNGTASLETPATTSSGCVDHMVISHVTGRGAAEMVRFWIEPPLVRDPDLALFGVVQLGDAEKKMMERATLRCYLAEDVRRMGPADAARAAVEWVHGSGNPFVLHFGVDVLAGFQATDDRNDAGLRLEEVREALEVFATQKELAAMEVTAYDPTKDADGSGAKLVVDLLAEVLAKRLEILSAPPQPEAAADSGEQTESAESPAPASTTADESSPAPASEAAAPSDSAHEQNPPKTDSELSESDSPAVPREADGPHS